MNHVRRCYGILDLTLGLCRDPRRCRRYSHDYKRDYLKHDVAQLARQMKESARLSLRLTKSRAARCTCALALMRRSAIPRRCLARARKNQMLITAAVIVLYVWPASASFPTLGPALPSFFRLSSIPGALRGECHASPTARSLRAINSAWYNRHDNNRRKVIRVIVRSTFYA